MRIISGPSSVELANKLGTYMSMPIVKTRTKRFPGGEFYFEFDEEIDKEDLLIVQSLYPPQDSHLEHFRRFPVCPSPQNPIPGEQHQKDPHRESKLQHARILGWLHHSVFCFFSASHSSEIVRNLDISKRSIAGRHEEMGLPRWICLKCKFVWTDESKIEPRDPQHVKHRL